MAERLYFVFGIILSIAGLISASQVDLKVYYESLCPDSDSFFHEQLSPTYNKLSSFLNVELVPYGNAHYRGQRDEYTFTCQHGAEECYGNMVQTCFITLVNDTKSQIDFVNCAFDSKSQKKSLEKCIESLDLRRQVKKCVTSPLGRNLEYEMAKKTDALNPPHAFIPWITINEQGNRELNNKAINNLLSVLCDSITVDKPKECQKAKWNLFKEFRNYYL